jgi:cystathionine beta-lyase
VEHGVFGYTHPSEELTATVVAMLQYEHGWTVRPDWIVWLPGLVTGINVACRAVGSQGGAVMTCTPVYPPFLSAPALGGRGLITVPHQSDGKRYGFDYDAIEKAITPETKLFLLCNPQNPTGRVFSQDELLKLAEICMRHGVAICSDEIHCGLVLDEDKQHFTIASLDASIAARTITLLAPSKTYNLPGLGCSWAVIPDQKLRSSFRKTMEGIVPHVNAPGLTATLAAYRDSEDWRLALIDYLRVNRDGLEDFVSRTEGLSMPHVEATYLAWIDCRELPAENPTLFFEDAGVGLSDGKEFGAAGFVRLNFGCPRSMLSEALLRMERAVFRLSSQRRQD